MKKNVLKLISQEDELTHIFILTYNIDFLFIEALLLPKLKDCGNPALTIFADLDRATESYDKQFNHLSYIGERYRVVPIGMDSGFCFHSKAILLMGKEKGKIIIGSGNLNYGGWRNNAELWIEYDTDNYRTPIQYFQNYLIDITQRTAINKQVRQEINTAYNEANHQWIAEQNPIQNLLFSPGNDQKLFAQVQEKLPSDITIDKIIICTPYFDRNSKILKKFRNKYESAEIDVLIQPEQCNLNGKAATKIKPQLNFKELRLKSSEDNNQLIHAKFYAFQSKKDVYLFLGSANCSQAALGISGKAGNAEILVMEKLPLDQFHDKIMERFEINKINSVLNQRFEMDENYSNKTSKLKIIGCGLNKRRITISIIKDKSISIKYCLIGNQKYGDLKYPDETTITINDTNKASSVQVVGELESKEIRSNKFWINNELSLQISSNKRKILKKFQEQDDPNNWDADFFYTITSLISEHLEYDSKSFSTTPKKTQSKDTDKTISYTKQDYMPDNNYFPDTPYSISYRSVGNFFEIVANLLNLGNPKNESKEQQKESEVKNNGGKPSKKKKKPTQISNKKKNKMGKIINKLADNFTNEAYIFKRSLSQINKDMQLISLLLRKGISERWISDKDFLSVSGKIWSHLFFYAEPTSEKKNDSGWLKYRISKSKNKANFYSSDLSASLLLWVSAIRFNNPSPEKSFFELACLEAISTMPNLWGIGNTKEVAKKFEHLLNTVDQYFDFKKEWKRTKFIWDKFKRRGLALIELKSVLKKYHLREVKNYLPHKAIEKGSLLWQGSLGFCITKKDYNYPSDIQDTIPIYCFRKEEIKKISSRYAIPLSSLLKWNEMQTKLSDKSRKELEDFMAEFTIIYK